MKTLKTLVLALILLLAFGCTKERIDPLNTILFEVESETALRVVTFIERDDIIVWDSSFTVTGKGNLEQQFQLQAGDYMLVSAITADGKFHYVETRISVDGVMMTERQKVCVNAGCGYEWEAK